MDAVGDGCIRLAVYVYVSLLGLISCLYTPQPVAISMAGQFL